jgi:hypothetical protein
MNAAPTVNSEGKRRNAAFFLNPQKPEDEYELEDEYDSGARARYRSPNAER